MRLAAIQPGDEIEVDVRGRIFPARVRELAVDDGPLGCPVRIEPLIDNCTYFHVSPRQIRRRLRRGDTGGNPEAVGTARGGRLALPDLPEGNAPHET